MDPDMVSVLKGLALGMYAHKPQHGSVKSIYSHVRRAASVSFLALVLDQFADKSVAGAANADLVIRGSGGMKHHAEVYIVHLTQLQKFLFAAEKIDFPLLAQRLFFGWHCHKRNITCKVLHGSRADKSHGCPQHSGHLSVMAAGMSGSGGWISMGMFRANHGVQFSHEGQADFRFSASHLSPDTCHSYLFPRLQTHFAHSGRCQFGRPPFLITQLRVLKNLLAYGNNLFTPGVNFLNDFLLELFNMHSFASS
jgi:hypothetical protein